MNWYFGINAGITFSTNPPTAISSSMVAYQGCNAISDNNGNLLYFTNGKTIYDRTGSVMSGTNIINASTINSPQNSLFVKKPGVNTEYLIFHCDPNTQGYSVINSTLSSGNGSLTLLNQGIPVPGNFGNSIIKHSNNIDYWFVTGNSGTFSVFPITSGGIGSTPVTSTCNLTSITTNWILRPAPDGRKIFVNGSLFIFNRLTGSIIFDKYIPGTYCFTDGSYSNYSYSEFSPDGSKLYYISSNYELVQLNLCAGSGSAIASSSIVIANSYGPSNYFSGLQVAPDGKIYVGTTGVWTHTFSAYGDTISVINNPNALGTACNFTNKSFKLAAGTRFQRNFPNLTHDQVLPPPPPKWGPTSCMTATFSPPNPCSTHTAIAWDFGDPNSGSTNTSTLTNPSHFFSSMGTFTVKAVMWFGNGGGVDTVRTVVSIAQPCATINTTSVTCATLGSGTVTTQGVGPFTFTWLPSNQTGSVASGLAPGNYTLITQSGNLSFPYSSTFTLSSPVPLTGQLSSQFSLSCFAASNGTAGYTNLSGGSAVQHFTWSNGNTTYTANTPSIASLSAGVWSVSVRDSLTGCVINDAFMILQPSVITPVVSTSQATICAGGVVSTSVASSGGVGAHTYSWVNGGSASTLAACSFTQNTAGNSVYTVLVTDANNCTVSGTVGVGVIANPVLSAPIVSICPLETASLSVSGASSYSWNGGLLSNATGSLVIDSPTIATVYSVSGTALGCSSTFTTQVVIKNLPVASIIAPAFVCEGQNLNLFSTGGSAAWSGPSFTSAASNPVIASVSLTNAGVYQLTVTAANNCTASTSASVVVKVVPTLVLSASSASVCLGVSVSSLVAISSATGFGWSPTVGIVSGAGSASVVVSPSVSTTYSLVATLDGCSVSSVVPVYVVAAPSLSVALSSGSMCAQAFNGSANTITLSASGAGTYSLLTPPEIGSSPPPAGQLSSLPPYSSGVKTATLLGSNGVCTVSQSVTFTVIPNPTVSVVNPTPNICAGNHYTYTAQGASSFTWSAATPGSSLYTSGGVSVASPSINSVFAVMGGSLGCYSASHTFSLSVFPLPTLAVVPVSNTVCLNSSSSFTAIGNAQVYTWLPNVFLSASMGSVVSVSPKQAQSYTVIGSLNNCTASASASIALWPQPVPLIHLSSPFVCSGSSITLNGFGGETYQWVDQKGYMYFTPSLTLVPLVQNALTLTVTDFRGCSERTNVVVPVKELPTGYLTSDHFSDCVPFSAHVKFVATNNHTLNAFNWQMGRLRFSSDFTHTFVTAGQYTVSGIITDDQGCKNATSLFINAYDKPLAKIKIVGDSVIENIAPVVLSSVSDDVYGIIRYQWYENTNLLSEEKSFSHLYDVSGKYPITLIVQNQFNCYDTVSKIVTISPDFAVYVPNAFTPTEDRLNETFQPVVRGVKLFRLWIYDRYGHEVFTSMDPLLGWDGTRGGVECEQGTYTWKIVVTSMEGEKKEMVGGVLLLR